MKTYAFQHEQWASMRSRTGGRQGAMLAIALLTMVGVAGRSAFGATIYVTTLQQKIGGPGTGGCSLQEAIYSSTLHDTFDGVHGIAIDATDQGNPPDAFVTTDCALGTGNDVIVLPTNGVLNLTRSLDDDAYNYMGLTATPIVISTITIQGNGATLKWAGGSANSRLFAVGSAPSGGIQTPNGRATGTGSLRLQNVYIVGFHVKGGDGAGGGGGGLGAGGAIYVESGSLTIENSTFDSNGAVGGKGGGASNPGGGGGLGGNGGTAHYLAGGGGGGARGNGGNALSNCQTGFACFNGGGGGGGTVFSGGNGGLYGAPGPGGLYCGGTGGGADSSGDGAACPGGGGGGGGFQTLTGGSGDGGSGNYGGGGGGGSTLSTGGNGGFGGGGGGNGGSGGFGGGGGNGDSPGNPGLFAGRGDTDYGGGGAALGGAIFNDSGSVVVHNSTFFNNFVARGVGGGGSAQNGGDAGGAIFSRDGSLTTVDVTVSGNQSTGSGGGMAVFSDSSASLTLEDTIVANNGANECFVARGGVGSLVFTTGSVANLIMNNGSGLVEPCPGVVTNGDPQLGPLQLNLGNTPTMGIASTASAAYRTADAATSLPFDQRGVARPQFRGFDIGAYEACSSLAGIIPCPVPIAPPGTVFETLTVQVSPAGGGTTNPVPGMYSEVLNAVIPLTATPNPGSSFVNWTGPVVDPTKPSTSVIMSSAETVTANFGPASLDTTPPVIVPQISGTPGNNGWYRSAVTVSWNVSDPESGIASSTGCGSTTLTTDTAGTPLTCSALNGAGLQSSVTVTIKIDQTPPVAFAHVAPAPNANGWNNTSVTVSFTGTDNLSGIDFCSPPITLTNSGAGQTAIGTCFDKAGNASAPVTVKVNIDKTGPVISGMPAPGCTLWPPDGGMVQVATVTAADALSGIAGGSFNVTGTSNEPSDPANPDIVITPNGSGGFVVQLRAYRLGTGTGRVYTLVATVTDLAGNSTKATATCTVPHDQTVN